MTTPRERLTMRRKGRRKKKERLKKASRQKHEARLAAREGAAIAPPLK